MPNGEAVDASILYSSSNLTNFPAEPALRTFIVLSKQLSDQLKAKIDEAGGSGGGSDDSPQEDHEGQAEAPHPVRDGANRAGVERRGAAGRAARPARS